MMAVKRAAILFVVTVCIGTTVSLYPRGNDEYSHHRKRKSSLEDNGVMAYEINVDGRSERQGSAKETIFHRGSESSSGMDDDLLKISWREQSERRMRLYDEEPENKYPYFATLNGERRNEFNLHGVGYFEYCIETNVSFYRHFDDAVRDITQGVTVDNTNEHECIYYGTPFILCNCSNLNYSFAPQTLTLKADLNGLDLSHNSITLGNASFQRYPELKYLSLANNLLKLLPNESFKGLNKLLVLDLQGNMLHMKDGVFPIGVFLPLVSLTALRINKNNKDVEKRDLFYPDETLADLKSLKYLSMDGLANKTFGRGFANLTNLETLSLTGYIDGHCKMYSLYNDTFQYLTQLRMLNLSDCHIKGYHVHSHALQPLINLHTLDLNWNSHLTMEKVVHVIKVLQNSGLKELFLKQVEPMFQTSTGINTSCECMPKHLTCLVASGNSISYLNPNVYTNLPKTLQYLDFSGNKIVFGPYIKGLLSLKNLKVLKLNGYDIIYNVPKSWPSPVGGQYMDSESTSKLMPYNLDEESGESEFAFPIPPEVRILTIEYAELRYYLTEINLMENNSLEELYLENNFLPGLIGPFKGFLKLRLLVLKSCNVELIKHEFFSRLPALELLDLKHNLLGTGTSLNHRPFQHLTSLIYLNIAFNRITHLKNDTFYGLSSLKELHIGGNAIVYFDATISNMKQLQVFELNETSIRFLPAHARKHIDSLGNITVSMSNTPIDCGCKNRNFLNWFAKSQAFASYSGNYICVLDVRKQMILPHEEMVSQVKIIGRDCAKHKSMFLLVLGATLLVCGLLIGSIVYRFRWRLRYLYYGLHLWVTGKSLQKEDQQFEYDVFISYSHEDLNFVLRKICPELHRRGLTTYIHSRDFKAGENIITNIIRAVKVSRKTLVVLTNNFIVSKWCRAEFQMAKEESVVTGRKILVFLIADTIPKSKIGLEILTHIQRNTYIPYHGQVDNTNRLPGEPDDQPISARVVKMWDKLVRDISK